MALSRSLLSLTLLLSVETPGQLDSAHRSSRAAGGLLSQGGQSSSTNWLNCTSIEEPVIQLVAVPQFIALLQGSSIPRSVALWWHPSPLVLSTSSLQSNAKQLPLNSPLRQCQQQGKLQAASRLPHQGGRASQERGSHLQKAIEYVVLLGREPGGFSRQ